MPKLQINSAMKLILDCIICVFGVNTGRSDLKIMSPENEII